MGKMIHIGKIHRFVHMTALLGFIMMFLSFFIVFIYKLLFDFGPVNPTFALSVGFIAGFGAALFITPIAVLSSIRIKAILKLSKREN